MIKSLVRDYFRISRMVKVVFIRHAEQAYNNEGCGDKRAPRYDAPATWKGLAEAEKTVDALLLAHGPPVAVISSPFRRARETAAMALSRISAHSGTEPKFAIDVRMSEYLGNQGIKLQRGIKRARHNNGERNNFSTSESGEERGNVLNYAEINSYLDPATLYLYTNYTNIGNMRSGQAYTTGPMIFESVTELKERVAHFLDALVLKYNGDDLVYVVSHGFTIANANDIVRNEFELTIIDKGCAIVLDV